ncbi:EamA family transporter [soil metagenome]
MRAGASSQRGSVLLVLGGIVSVQCGAAVAIGLFDDVGPGGTVFLRVAISALLLIAIWRPSIPGADRPSVRRDVVAFGLVLAGMNFSFYEALDRIPLGIAVTLEFIGPLGVAVLRSRRRLDLAWAGLAALGILLLSPLPGGSLDLLGMALALLAGAFWGAYIVLAARLGEAFTGGRGLALAMAVGAIVLIPVGIAQGGSQVIGGGVLLAGVGVAILSSAIHYSLEMEALRRLPEGVFGVLMSIEPAVAALVGFVGLSQDLSLREVIAIGFVLAASAGALSSSADPPAEA